MKKFVLILFIIVFVMTLSSCGYPEVDEQLQGVWVLKSSDFEAVHTFSFADGTVNIHSENSYGKTGTGTYSISEDKIQIKWTEVTDKYGNTKKDKNGVSVFAFQDLSYTYEDGRLTLYWGSYQIKKK